MQQDKKSSALRTTLLTIGVSVAISAATFLFPVPETAVDPTATHWRAFASTLLFLLFVGAAIVFLRSLKNFKPKVRVAYRYFAYGFLALTLTLVQFIFWGLLDLWQSEWAQSGSGIFGIAIGCMLIYAGARKFSRLLGLKSIINSFWFVSVISLLVGAAFYLITPFAIQYHHIEGMELYIAICTWGSTYLFFASWALYKISKNIGSYYTHAMRWLAIGIFGLFIETSHEGISTFWFNNGDVYTEYGFYLIPFVIAGFLLTYAAYQFRLLPFRAIAAGDIDPEEAKNAKDSDYVDSVVAVGGLVSQPQEIEKILDGLRNATANFGPNSPLSQANKDEIVKTYFSLEDYLTKNDAFQTYTKEQVRSNVTVPFRAIIEASPAAK